MKIEDIRLTKDEMWVAGEKHRTIANTATDKAIKEIAKDLAHIIDNTVYNHRLSEFEQYWLALKKLVEGK